MSQLENKIERLILVSKKIGSRMSRTEAIDIIIKDEERKKARVQLAYLNKIKVNAQKARILADAEKARIEQEQQEKEKELRYRYNKYR